MNNIVGQWECPHCGTREPRSVYDGDAPLCEVCDDEHYALVEMQPVGDDGEEMATDGGSDTCTGDTGRWDTPCGVHHGWVFASGVCFGLLIAMIGVMIVL